MSTVSKVRVATCATSATVALALACIPGAAQSAFQARLSTDTVQVGDVFELLVSVPVPAGSVVYFPDTVATTPFLESHAPVRWESEAAADGGALLALAYPVMAYGLGVVPVSGFDVFVGPSGGPVDGAPLPGGSVVGDWRDLAGRGVASLRPFRVPRRGVWVREVFTHEQLEAGVDPQPSNDVVGSSWHWPSVLLALLSTAFLVPVVGRPVMRWLRARSLPARAVSGSPWTPETSRRHALDELDRLLAERLHTTGRTHELYARSSGVVRSFVGRLDVELGADLTGTELIRTLTVRLNGGARRNGGDGSRTSRFFDEMRTAEVVKFGRLRPPAEEADAHILALRTWVEGSREGPWGQGAQW